MDGPDRERSAWMLGAAAVVLATVLVLPFHSYVTDDTYIHLQFARNVLQGQGWAFNPGEPTYGFTSPLWILLLAAAGSIGAELLAASKVLGLVCTWGSIVAFHAVARSLIPSRAGRAAALLTWTVNAWLLRWTLSGMETSLVACLVLAGLAFHFRERREDRLPWVSGLCWGLSALSRPECYGLVLLAGLDHLWADRPARIRRLLALAAASGVVLAPWLGFVIREFGQVFPNTAYAKAGTFALAPGDLFRVARRATGLIGASNAGETILVLVAAFASIRRAPAAARSWFREHSLLVLWIVALVALYSTRGTVLVSRYFVPALGTLVLLGFLAIDTLRASAAIGAAPGSARAVLARRAPWLASALFAAQNLVLLYAVALPPALSLSRGLEESLVSIGRWVRENTPPAATIAAADIGALGYYSERRIIDLSGLITPSMIEPQREMPLDEFVSTLSFAKVFRPDYLVDRYETPDRFADIPEAAGITEMLFHRRIGPLGIRRSSDFHYTVYRMHWDRHGAPGLSRP